MGGQLERQHPPRLAALIGLRAATHGVFALPADWCGDVRRYLVERAAAGRSLATLRSDAATLAAIHTASHHPNPCAPGSAMSAMLTRLAKHRRPATGVTFLRHFIPSVSSIREEGLQC